MRLVQGVPNRPLSTRPHGLHLDTLSFDFSRFHYSAPSTPKSYHSHEHCPRGYSCPEVLLFCNLVA